MPAHFALAPEEGEWCTTPAHGERLSHATAHLDPPYAVLSLPPGRPVANAYISRVLGP